MIFQVVNGEDEFPQFFGDGKKKGKKKLVTRYEMAAVHIADYASLNKIH